MSTDDYTAAIGAPFNWTPAVDVQSFSPLYVSGDGWSLDFQEKPTMRVLRRGRVPTFEEAARAMQYTTWPVPFAALLPIIAASVPEVTE